MDTRTTLRRAIKRALKNLLEKGELKALPSLNVKIERPQREGQGDYSSNVAMQIASFTKRKPKTVAKIIASELQKDEKLNKILKSINVAPPGFINFYVQENYLRKALVSIFKEDNFGCRNIGKGVKLNLEFISVNPTGELHIGHGRTAFYGDVLANILQCTGYKVTREYYINNARQSAQIKELGKTALKRGTSYKSPYLDKKISEFSARLRKIKKPETAGYFLAGKIQADIKKFLQKEAKIKFDVWIEEESLYKKDEVRRTMAELKKKKLIYEDDGAIWLKTTKYGDNQDQVLTRSNGENTYFTSDIAYHKNKAKRGFKKIINIWGADHQGHVRRMKAAARIFKINDIEILISQLVSLKGRLRLSKRKGNIINLKDLMDAVGLDVVRYFYLTKSLDSQMEFDLQLAKKQSQKNPVYYVQYTHARICSIIRKSGIKNNELRIINKELENLKEKEELELIKKLTVFPDIIEDIAQDYQVHRLTTYLHELAHEFNQFYRDHKVLIDDNTDLREARLALTVATGIVLKKCLDLLGINAPEKM